jgi:hypothetical protein
MAYEQHCYSLICWCDYTYISFVGMVATIPLHRFGEE